ncbi:MAG: efflux RND transporter periplasmic adaptor subunit [Syntrophaceae bacterium]|nr:efflux RND transporter periplasmic adaptor subunit [Syntrophaceae bacterium]
MQRLNRARGIAAVVFLTGILLLNGCGTPSAPQGSSARPPEVAVLTIQPRPLVVTTELTGRASAYRVAEVRPQVSGLIQKRFFSEGSYVQAGQSLYLLDPAPYQAALNTARAALAKAEAGLPAIRVRAERMKELLADRAVSQQDVDDVAAQLRQTEADIQNGKAAVEAAQINLDNTRINAPISGRIGLSSVTEGALISAYQPQALGTIQQLDPIYIDVSQSTTELLQLRRRLEEGQLQRAGGGHNKVALVLEDNSPYPWAGELQFRDVTVDPTTGSVILRIVVPNPKGILLPGMFVRAIVEEGVNRQAILVPQEAVSRDHKGAPMALVVDQAEDKVQQRQITIDRAIGSQWLVTSGLEHGERLIVEGGFKVRPGMPVKAVPWGETPNPSVGESSGHPAIPTANAK